MSCQRLHPRCLSLRHMCQLKEPSPAPCGGGHDTGHWLCVNSATVHCPLCYTVSIRQVLVILFCFVSAVVFLEVEQEACCVGLRRRHGHSVKALLFPLTSDFWLFCDLAGLKAVFNARTHYSKPRWHQIPIIAVSLPRDVDNL